MRGYVKKIVWGLILVAAVSYVVLSNDPLNDTVNFIIAGSIPGTKISIGFWSTMLVAGALLFIIRRAVKNAQHTMIASEIEKKKRTKEMKEATELEFDHSKRAIIAAPSHKSMV